MYNIPVVGIKHRHFPYIYYTIFIYIQITLETNQKLKDYYENINKNK